MERTTTLTPHGGPEDRREDAAFRWVLGLGALAGAWWAAFALLASRA